MIYQFDYPSNPPDYAAQPEEEDDSKGQNAPVEEGERLPIQLLTSFESKPEGTETYSGLLRLEWRKDITRH